MELFVNEYSLHGQCNSETEVLSLVKKLRSMRETAGKYDVGCFVSRGLLLSRPILAAQSLRNVLFQLRNKDSKTLLLSWLSKAGPFWEDARRHASDDYIVFQNGDDEPITDSAVGEATFRNLAGADVALLSACPSNVLVSPVQTKLLATNDTGRESDLENYWTVESLDAALRNVQCFHSWDDASQAATIQFKHLSFSHDAFVPILSYPFSPQLATRIMDLLRILDQTSSACLHGGALNERGKALHQQYFVGEKSLFADSMDGGKGKFESDMTFANPLNGAKELFGWHGKIKMGHQYRIHFQWPKADPSQPLPVVYVGPKIAMR